MYKPVRILIFILLAYLPASAQWTVKPTSMALDFEAITMTDSLNGYTCGQSGMVLRTTDGGESWSKVPCSYPFVYHAIHFTDSIHGFIVGDEESIMQTPNGGRSWTKRNLGTVHRLNGVCFYNADTGFIAGDKGYLIYTVDSGHTWKGDSTYTRRDLNSIYIAPGNTIIVTGDSGLVLRRRFGDSGWSHIQAPTPVNLLRSFFINAEKGFIVGGQFDSGMYKNAVLRTLDSGKTWTPLFINNARQLNSVWFANADTGYICGSNGMVFRSVDGGANWYRLNLSFIGMLHDINFFAPGTGLMVADGGKIFKTRNAGGFVVGIDKVAPAVPFSVYPNPAPRQFVLSGANIPAIFHVSVCDAAGKEVWRGIWNQQENPSLTVQTLSWPAGNYWINVSGHLLTVPAVIKLLVP